MVTNKEILEMANNDHVMYLLSKIKYVTENLCSQTEYEQKTAKDEIKEYVKEIKEELKK